MYLETSAACVNRLYTVISRKFKNINKKKRKIFTLIKHKYKDAIKIKYVFDFAINCMILFAINTIANKIYKKLSIFIIFIYLFSLAISFFYLFSIFTLFIST